VRGPLLLIPARLELGQGKREARWLLQLEVEEPVVNAALLGAIRKHRGLQLPESLRAEVLAELQVGVERGSEPLQAIAGVYGLLSRLLVAAGLPLSGAQRLPPQSLTPLTKAGMSAVPVPLSLTGEVVLGLYPQSSTALYADFGTMIERALAGEGDMGLVDDLLEVPAEQTLDSGAGLGSSQLDGDLPEGSVHCVIPTDPSQYLVVKMAQEADALVVRGPPGTGKSQTIVNLVSDAMARNKRVLVVCQKRAALDVVYRRLSDVGLAGSAALVHDAAADRPALYKRLHAQMQGADQPAPSALSEHVALQIDEATHKLRSVVDPLGTTLHGLALHELYARAQHGFQPCLDVPQELARADRESVERVCAAMERAKDGHLRFDQSDHPLSLRKDWSDLSHLESARLKQALQLLAKEAQGGGLVPALPDAMAGIELARQLPAFLSVRTRWYRWFLPSWWRAKNTVERALSWFLGSAPDTWPPLLERHARLDQTFTMLASFMQPSWDQANRPKLNILSELAELADIMTRAVTRDLEPIRVHDRVRGELTKEELEMLERFAVRLRPEADWAEHLHQEVLLRWIDEAERIHPRLRDRIAGEHAALCTQIRVKEGERRTLIAKELAGQLRVRATTPSFDPKEKSHGNRKPTTEWNKLAHEFGKKRLVKAIRTLNSEFSWPMQQQVRCWLASPEVVAEVFPLERGHFDIVIFDEASQLTLERALPVVYRARQCVIAGDEQQMPPSNFFGATIEEDELEGDDGDAEPRGEARFAESLLAQGKRIRGFRYLAWHYRSEFQQLIEFSNQAFYDGALQVAANLDCSPREPPMRFIKVDGIWLDQTNPVEANRTVDEIKTLLLHHSERPRSLGVITFNAKQQAMILDEIENRRGSDPEFGVLWDRAQDPESGSLDDRPFVKNIENVQGDERDYILFSVGYAPGPDGVLRRNFGPLGLTGGENRLNVAITRAKRGIRVICSFDPKKLVTEGAKNRGPQLLKQYLCYVHAVSMGDQSAVQQILSELNREHFSPQGAATAPHFDSPLEEQVYDALTRHGLKIHTQWGAGGYHIDLVVVDPADSSRLCLGIECDGAAYHTGRSVRERDIARQSFLEQRGWRIHRIWSADWWRDPEGETQRVLALARSNGAQLAAPIAVGRVQERNSAALID